MSSETEQDISLEDFSGLLEGFDVSEIIELDFLKETTISDVNPLRLGPRAFPELDDVSERLNNMVRLFPVNDGLDDFAITPRSESNNIVLEKAEELPEDVQEMIISIAQADTLGEKLNLAHMYGQRYIEGVNQDGTSPDAQERKVSFFDLAHDPRGDCDDFVLFKKGLLVHAGVDPDKIFEVGALIETVEGDKTTYDGHAMLFVEAENSGDFYLLDNNLSSVDLISGDDLSISGTRTVVGTDGKQEVFDVTRNILSFQHVRDAYGHELTSQNGKQNIIEARSRGRDPDNSQTISDITPLRFGSRAFPDQEAVSERLNNMVRLFPSNDWLDDFAITPRAENRNIVLEKAEDLPEDVQEMIVSIAKADTLYNKLFLAHVYAKNYIQGANQDGSSPDAQERDVSFFDLAHDPKGDSDEHVLFKKGLLVHAGVDPDKIFEVGALIEIIEGDKTTYDGHGMLFVEAENSGDFYLLDNHFNDIPLISADNPSISGTRTVDGTDGKQEVIDISYNILSFQHVGDAYGHELTSQKGRQNIIDTKSESVDYNNSSPIWELLNKVEDAFRSMFNSASLDQPQDMPVAGLVTPEGVEVDGQKLGGETAKVTTFTA
tara:strand:- start:867 stop:2678 length:1812 start_codon:yes stop_codon:yes gene_type:complete